MKKRTETLWSIGDTKSKKRNRDNDKSVLSLSLMMSIAS